MTTDELSVGLDATGISILADGPENISSSTSTSTTGKEDGYLCINRFTQNTATTQDNQSRDSDDDEDDCGSHDEADEDSDERQYSMTPERPHKITEKKRADHAAFHDWLQSNSSEIAQSTPQPAQNLNHTSTALMVRESENRKIIENPREYQIELFERAKRKNIIAVLPTGSGKTLIAALLLRHTLEQETADRRAGKPKRIAFFLVEKVALALQQHAVLECNLEFPIDRVCGDMVRSDWIKESWMKRWDDNMVMVCTAAILQQCLARSFIRMDQINLLVFDEAHHAKGNHPYARIIKDYYITEPDKERRPKIFGMTASPVDALTDVKIAAAQLEGLLHSEIATIEEDSVSFKQIQKEVVEQDCKYPALEPPFTTNLHKKIQEQVRYNKNFAKALSNSLEMSSSLGSWCVDRFWQIFLTEETLARMAAQTAQDNIFADRAEKERVAIEEVRNIIKQHQFLPITKTLQDLSSKVLCLLGQLELRFSAPTDHKCIIFVEKRNTAMILAHLLSLPGIGPLYLKPAALVGNPSDNSPLAMSYKEQVMTITKFRRGEYNCLLATSVAEEGIDIADCNIVIRFDLFNSVIQYIQSKGRARHLNSEYICMAELGNGKHTRAKIQANYDLSLIRQFCSTLPEDRKIVGWDPEAALHHGERDHKFHIVPSTGAKLTWTGSLVVLSNFASSLQVNDETLSPSYMVSLIGSEYICEVQLPSKSPILSVSGTLQKNKAEARCSAAFEMCMKLIKGGFISSHLQPTFTRKLPAMRNARLAISSKKRERYNMRVKPEPLQISTLPVEVVAMAYNFPAIIHRIESNMIALDGCRMLNLRVRPDLALEAMTKDPSNSEEHDQEKIDFQAGMGNNYERLEFLGDCFLKMATTIALFTRIPDSNEFEYHVERMLLICNQNLFNVALKKNLQEYIRSKQFDRRSWYPQGLKQKAGKAQGAQNSHSLADKSIADVCEAIIGASYLSYTDEGNFDMAVRAVTAVVRNKNHDMKSYEDYYKAFKMPIWQAAEPSAVQMEASLQIKEQMGYEFKSPALLRSAFKHPSYPRQFESVPNYQRLEFLGDALLDMVCVDFLFRKFPDADPQWLTEHKMAMVSNHFLGSLSVELGFYRRVLHFNSIMANQIKDYVDALTHARQEAEAVAQISGTVSRDYWLNVKHPPKFLSDVVEAYIGAIFVDSGYDYGQVQAFFEKHIRPFFADMALYDSFASSHPVTTLARMMQQDFGCQDWRLLLSELPPSCEDGGAAAITETEVICGFMVHGRILLHAKSSSGRYAKVGAAKRAVEKLMGLGNDKEVFRTDFGCDCDCEGQAI
ncbi:hypothetical protein VD0004_g6673 [Verticillium dahliae]|nr:hypothetical protein VD0004_g6673 [Verticillium dahliae]